MHYSAVSAWACIWACIWARSRARSWARSRACIWAYSRERRGSLIFRLKCTSQNHIITKTVPEKNLRHGFSMIRLTIRGVHKGNRKLPCLGIIMQRRPQKILCNRQSILPFILLHRAPLFNQKSSHQSPDLERWPPDCWIGMFEPCSHSI